MENLNLTDLLELRAQNLRKALELGEELRRISGPLQQQLDELSEQAQRLEKEIDQWMTENQKEKAEAAGFVVSYRKSYRTIVEDENLIPDHFCKVVRQPVLNDIKKAINEGEVVPGARIETKQNLQIKEVEHARTIIR